VVNLFCLLLKAQGIVLGVMDSTTLTLKQLADFYRTKKLSPVEVTQTYLKKLRVDSTYLKLLPERALAQAKCTEEVARGVDDGFLQGIPIALKDLLDTKGDVTTSGSKVLAEGKAAQEDAALVQTLDKAGAIFLGKTNMTELAFSGIGMNPHYGTPGCALDKTRIPGGSSSGSAVAVAEGLACAAIGSDTGGSVRIPASFNGLVGLKTTNGQISTEGCVPLSTTLDTLGPITKTVEDAWLLYLAMVDKPFEKLSMPKQKLNFLVPTTLVFNEVEDEVAIAFEAVCQRLEQQGHTLTRQAVPAFQTIFNLYAQYGSFASHESLALYETMLEQRGDEVDPRVGKRILALKGRSSTDYLKLVYTQKQLIKDFWQTYKNYDAILCPTVAILPPTMKALEDDAAYFKANNLVLRNTSLFNFLAGPSISVPCGTTAQGLSVGLMISAEPQREKWVLELASLIEENG
jgi:aspartyl-tRNA(Asn)/glutamyl-tRNA(Gln) amidotransferase subunit A